MSSRSRSVCLCARPQDLHRFFLPQSVLVWEGTAVQGADQCRQLFEMLPSSKHTIASFDVQPVTGQEQKQQRRQQPLPMRSSRPIPLD